MLLFTFQYLLKTPGTWEHQYTVIRKKTVDVSVTAGVTSQYDVPNLGEWPTVVGYALSSSNFSSSG